MEKLLELKNIAEKLVNPRYLGENCHVASVASALFTEGENIYTGVCIDTGCGMGFCAEHAAIAQMITNGEKKIKMIVAVGEKGLIFPPCGRCREFMYQICNENLNTEILVANGKKIKLDELLPYRLKI